MQRTRLGQTDLEISRVVFGSMGRRPASATDRIRVLHAAIDAGTTTIDTAPLYDFGEVEQVVGEAIRDRRERVELLSKVGLRWDDEHGDILFEFNDAAGRRRAVRRDSRPGAIRKDVEESLLRLGTDRIELCQIHHLDPHTPLSESLGELARLVEEGKILHVGVSNFSGDALDETIDTLSRLDPIDQLASDQLHYSLLERSAEQDILPRARRQGFGLLAYSPLEAGALTGTMLTPERYDHTARGRGPLFRPENARSISAAIRESVEPVSARHGASVDQVCLAWLLHRESVDGVIAGASSVDQALSNAAAADLSLSPEEVETIEGRFAAVRIDPMAGEAWRTRAHHLYIRARRRLGRLVRGR